MSNSRILALFAVLLLCSSCTLMQSEFVDNPTTTATDDNVAGPGTIEWGDEDVSCQVESDCALGETCISGICQMQRCSNGPYLSEPPVTSGFRFFLDNELVVTDGTDWEGSFWTDGYRTADSDVEYGQSWSSNMPIVDVAGGKFLDSLEEVVARASTGTTTVRVGDDTEIAFGFTPVALAAGDVDRDHQDELIALSAAARLAICNVPSQQCDFWDIDGATGIDVTAGDVDGDGYEEALLLVEFNENSAIVVLNADPDVEPADQSISNWVTQRLVRLDAGDLDGDGIAEMIGLEDGSGWFDWLLGASNDRMIAYSLQGAGVAELGGGDLSPETNDVAVGDLDADRIDEVVVLNDDNTVEILSGEEFTAESSGEPSWQLLFESLVDTTTTPQRITLADFDGDSPAVELVGGPDLVPGRIVPTMALYFPPYDGQHSNGTSSIVAGQTESQSESYSDSVSLGLGVEVGVGADFLGVFGAKLSSRFRHEISRNHELSRTMTVGHRFSNQPDPSLYGHSYGVVFLAVGCFHSYTYRYLDPAGIAGGHEEEFVTLLPIDGHSTAWSTSRYNAMAEAVGDLPLIDVPSALGDPDSYMQTLQQPDGSLVEPDDLVFPESPQFLVSDVASLGWWLSAEERETNSVAMNSSLDISTSVSVSGVRFGAQVGVGWGQGYSVSLGSRILLGGSVPPIPDNPETPEDEYVQNRFSFMPVVYRSHYDDPAGNDASFYVLDYVVGQ